jgi:hypothetical protein
VFDAGGDLSGGLVQAARELGPFAVFVQRNRGGGHRGARVSDVAHPDSRAIRSARALDTCARVGPPALVCGIRATLPARGTTLAGLEHLRCADPGADCQFHPYAEHQFPEAQGHLPPRVVGRRDGLVARRRAESLGHS